MSASYEDLIMITKLSRILRLNRYNPRIARSTFIDVANIMLLQGVGPQASLPILFIVASVELGNTTTKCIVTATDLKSGKVYLVRKVVRLTREIREPLPGEQIIGSTLWGKVLSEEAVAEFIKDVLITCIKEARIDKDRDLHFVVRSTGVSASFGSPEEVGAIIRALAKGCLIAGINPSKMVAPISKDFLAEQLRDYSKLDKVYFDGAVAGCLPPRSIGEIMANEMEAELSTAGIKIGAKWTDVDCRNPMVSMDFGTTFKGRVTNDELPYAKTIGSICGISGAICDSLIQGAQVAASALEYSQRIKHGKVKNIKECEELAYEVHKYINIDKIPPSKTRVGTVPVNAKSAHEQGIILIGCDAGDNGSNLPKLRSLGQEIYTQFRDNAFLVVLDYVSALIAKRVLEVLIREGVINHKYTIGITGRAGITGLKPYLVLKYIHDLGLFKDDINRRVVFVEDGLALGANVMARCMHSLGTPHNPLGGNRGMGCILGLRMELQRNRREREARSLN
ncbi:MAG: methanogenesis marker 14 protein [Candidatus Nezhaarchaeales archaeon]